MNIQTKRPLELVLFNTTVELLYSTVRKQYLKIREKETIPQIYRKYNYPRKIKLKKSIKRRKVSSYRKKKYKR